MKREQEESGLPSKRSKTSQEIIMASLHKNTSVDSDSSVAPVDTGKSDDAGSSTELDFPDESGAWFIGVHTLMPKLMKNKHMFEHIPLLKQNNGRLPPFMVCVGDKRRVRSAGKLLDNVVFLHDEVQKQGGDVGRVAIALGTYKGTPIAIFEHQMGCGGAEIICRELVSPVISSRKYNASQFKFNASEKYVIRVGSCGGINSGKETKKEEIVRVYDAIVSSHSVGISGCNVQASLGALNFLGINLEEARAHFEKLGYKVHDDGWTEAKCDLEFSKSLQANIRAKLKDKGSNATSHLLGSFSKDSLYCEAREENFMKLRERFNVGCTEMEFDAVLSMAKDFTARGEPVKVGMACVAIGVLPGASFAIVNKEEAQRSIDSTLLGAFETLFQYSVKSRNLKTEVI